MQKDKAKPKPKPKPKSKVEWSEPMQILYELGLELLGLEQKQTINKPPFIK